MFVVYWYKGPSRYWDVVQARNEKEAIQILKAKRSPDRIAKVIRGNGTYLSDSIVILGNAT